jgi:hypothetical protein
MRATRWLAMTVARFHAHVLFPRRNAPELHRNHSPQNEEAQGMPGARCTRGLVCKLHEMRTRAYRFSGGDPTFPAQWFTAYGALSPATNSSCHRHRRIKGFVAPGWADENLRRFDTSNGCQDHTVLPYASAPFVCALCIAHGKTALQSVCAPTLPRPPHPVPTFVTMANAPLLGPGWGELVSVICPTAEAKYFSQRGWTGFD